jgi:hypothetical protein
MEVVVADIVSVDEMLEVDQNGCEIERGIDHSG